jgi:hypothetical protein
MRILNSTQQIHGSSRPLFTSIRAILGLQRVIELTVGAILTAATIFQKWAGLDKNGAGGILELSSGAWMRWMLGISMNQSML